MAIFATGTRTLIVGGVAPVGWTKNTTNYNNHKLRVTSGTASFGGSRDFDTVFTSQGLSGYVDIGAPGGADTTGSTTLTAATLPDHTHYGAFQQQTNSAFGSPGTPVIYGSNGGASTNTGGGGGHAHPLGTLSLSVSTTVDFGVKYVDVIIVTKD